MVPSATLTYVADNDTNGLMYWLGSLGNTRVFQPTDLITATASSVYTVGNEPERLFDRSATVFMSNNTVPEYAAIDLGAAWSLEATDILLKASSSITSIPQNFNVEGSQDGVAWDVLVENHTALIQDTWQRYQISPSVSYRHFRVISTGPQGGGYNNLGFEELELYGNFSGETQYTGRLIESSPETNFIVRANRVSDGHLVGQALTENDALTYDIWVSTDQAIEITVRANQGEARGTSTTYVLDDKMFPADTITTPFYYRCVTGGTVGLSEPVWPTEIDDVVIDGSVTWKCLGGLVRPAIHGPLTSLSQMPTV